MAHEVLQRAVIRIPVQSRHEILIVKLATIVQFLLPRFPSDCNDLLRAPTEEKIQNAENDWKRIGMTKFKSK